MFLNGNRNGHDAIVEKIKCDVTCDQVDNKWDGIWIFISITLAENKVQNHNKCERIENGPNKTEKILDVAFLEFTKAQSHQEIPVQEDLVKKIQGFPEKLFEYPHRKKK